MIRSTMSPEDIFVVEYVESYLRQSFLGPFICKWFPWHCNSLFSTTLNQYAIGVFLVICRTIVLDRVYPI